MPVHVKAYGLLQVTQPLFCASKETEMSSIVALDANVLIYYLDSGSEFHELAQRLLESFAPDTQVVMSALARTEILNLPFRLSPKTGTEIAHILDSFDLITFIPVDMGIADLAARLIGESSSVALRNVDAIHLATALQTGAEVLYTNDQTLLKVAKIRTLAINPLS